jgi:hypothetical protein
VNFDPTQPMGTSLNRLGWKENATPGYLLGVACACGNRSLVVAGAFEAAAELLCPRCGSSLR